MRAYLTFASVAQLLSWRPSMLSSWSSWSCKRMAMPHITLYMLWKSVLLHCGEVFRAPGFCAPSRQNFSDVQRECCELTEHDAHAGLGLLPKLQEVHAPWL